MYTSSCNHQLQKNVFLHSSEYLVAVGITRAFKWLLNILLFPTFWTFFLLHLFFLENPSLSWLRVLFDLPLVKEVSNNERKLHLIYHIYIQNCLTTFLWISRNLYLPFWQNSQLDGPKGSHNMTKTNHC